MLVEGRSVPIPRQICGRCCGFPILRNLAWILVWINLVTVQCNLQLVDGGYEDVVVEIDASVPAKDCSTIFRGLEVSFLIPRKKMFQLPLDSKLMPQLCFSFQFFADNV